MSAIPGGYPLFPVNRRDFLRISALSTAVFAAGCAVNPVTGEKQLMLMSEAEEIQVDQQNSPHQFSADYGFIQDRELNDYIQRTGKMMADRSHRPQMPYNFHGVNATYVNAYAFPGGSIAATRGILLTLENEAELSALLGHELGHVNARHTAERMSKTLLTQMALSGVSAFVTTANENLAPLAAGLGGIGAGLLLAKYSRDDERQADSLGMEYMVRTGNNPEGMVGLMDILRNMSKHKPEAIEMMFASHPMSEERYRTAADRAKSQYGGRQKAPFNKERYMDHTARLRKLKDAVEKMQNGESAMAGGNFTEAEAQFKAALKQAPSDYAGLLMMAKCQLARDRYDEAQRYAGQAEQVYPKEGQAHHVLGMARLKNKDYDGAYAEFNRYENLLPGNPNTIFLKGYTLEGMQDRSRSASEYARYLQKDSTSDQAKHAYQKLVEWGYVKKQ